MDQVVLSTSAHHNLSYITLETMLLDHIFPHRQNTLFYEKICRLQEIHKKYEGVSWILRAPIYN